MKAVAATPGATASCCRAAQAGMGHSTCGASQAFAPRGCAMRLLRDRLITQWLRGAGGMFPCRADTTQHDTSHSESVCYYITTHLMQRGLPFDLSHMRTNALFRLSVSAANIPIPTQCSVACSVTYMCIRALFRMYWTAFQAVRASVPVPNQREGPPCRPDPQRGHQ